MQFDQFKFMLGETICYFQLIEHDIKLIYAIMLKGSFTDNLEAIKNRTLGDMVKELEILDNSDNHPLLSSDSYRLLKTITRDRNYLCHKIYTSFIYIPNFEKSKEYLKACSRVKEINNNMSELWIKVEDVRLKASQIYRKLG